MIRKAVAKIKSEVPDGQTDDIVAFLTDKVNTSTRVADKDVSPGMKSVNSWINTEASQAVENWLRINNSSAVTQHPSFVSITSSLYKTLKLDVSADDDFNMSMTLADCVWSFGEAIFDQIPAAVPSLATATVAKISNDHRPGETQDLRTTLPSCCHFLCVASSERVTNDVALRHI